jgi:hypothetical protein
MGQGRVLGPRGFLKLSRGRFKKPPLLWASLTRGMRRLGGTGLGVASWNDQLPEDRSDDAEALRQTTMVAGHSSRDTV